MTDIAWRKFITCTIVSIPTESRFTYTLRRSIGIFANSVFIATVGGILSISADVWNEPNRVYKNSWYTMLTQWSNVFGYANVIKARWRKMWCVRFYLGRCVHLQQIQDYKNSWTTQRYLYKWHYPCCSCGYRWHIHWCLNWNPHTVLMIMITNT